MNTGRLSHTYRPEFRDFVTRCKHIFNSPPPTFAASLTDPMASRPLQLSADVDQSSATNWASRVAGRCVILIRCAFILCIAH